MYDVIIVGGGPAGQSAAIFLSRAGKRTLIIDDGKGLTQRALIKNHYGIMEITGGDIVAAGQKQVEKYGTDIANDRVTNIEKKEYLFNVITDEGASYEAPQVILCTGSNATLADAIGLETKPGVEPYVKKTIKVDVDGRTSIPGIWAAGTAGGVSVHIIITSGDGARVAVNPLSELQGSRYVDHDAVPKQ